MRLFLIYTLIALHLYGAPLAMKHSTAEISIGKGNIAVTVLPIAEHQINVDENTRWTLEFSSIPPGVTIDPVKQILKELPKDGSVDSLAFRVSYRVEKPVEVQMKIVAFICSTGKNKTCYRDTITTKIMLNP